MKVCANLKLILLVGLVHVSHSLEADQDNVISDDRELRYIVWVTTAGGTTQLRQYGERACTGTLIRYDLVITLASCLLIDRRDDVFPDIIVVHERPSGHILQALKIFINPNFYSEDNYESNSHDFGLILVERSEQSAYPQLPQRPDNFQDIKDTCVMGGYGADSNVNVKDNFRVFDMKKTDLYIFTGRSCSGVDKICLHFFDIMPCEADFGTPLICGGVVYALYTPRHNRHSLFTNKCLDFYITVFSPVYYVKDWVTHIIDAPTSNLEWLNNPWYVLLLCCVVFAFMGGIYYGLVEFLQRTFDPAEGMQAQMSMSLEEDEESWYESQWVTR